MSKSRRAYEICGIREKYSAEKLFFARFPLKENVCKEWVKKAGKEDLVYVPIEKLHGLRFVCEKHFGKRDFTKTRTRLKKHAVPKHQLTMPSLTEQQMIEFPFHVASSQRNELASTSQHSVPVATVTQAQEFPVDVPSKCQQSLTELKSLPSSSQQNVASEAVLGVTHDHVAAGDVPPETVQSVTKSILLPASLQPLVPDAVPVAIQECVISIDVAPKSEQSVTESRLPQPPSSIVKEVHEPSGSVQSKGTKRKLHDEVDATPRKKKLLKQLKQTKCTLSSLKKSAQLIENLASPVLKEIVMSALKNQKRKPQGKRWTTKNKISALAIFKRSPKTYRYLQHIIPLPCIKTLQNLLKKIPIEPGINGAVLKHLTKISEKQNMKNKLCVLLFDEIALKQRLVYNENTDKIEGFIDSGKEDERTSDIADHALVFLLQGVGKKFKQPLSFYFVKGTVSSQKLAVLIKENIRAVENTGHRVIATVCDQGPTNIGGLKLLREWSNGGENYFKVEDKEIFILYDVPHLFKSIRNNFLNNGRMEMDGKKAKWEHLIEVEEQNRAFLYLTKITPTHVRPKYRAKMKVKYAAQVLSQTVAAVLKLLAQSKNNEERRIEIEETASVVEQLNKLFDFANGPSSADDVKKKIRENVSERSNHLEVWEDFKKKMTTVKFYSKNGSEAKNVRCVDGWKITLTSLRCIWHVVKSYGFKYLNLRQLNQDALENLFGIIRQHSPTDKHPTCSGFMGALKTSIVAGLTAPHSKGSNCEKDKLLTDFHDILFGDSQCEEGVETESNESLAKNVPERDVEVQAHCLQTKQPSESWRSFHICEEDEKLPTISINDLEDMEIESDLSDIAQQPLVYVSGYIAYITLKKHKMPCTKCKDSLTVSDHLGNPIYNIIQLREWWKDKTSLKYPSVNLCRTIETAIRIFQDEVQPFLHRRNICQWTVTMFHLHCSYNWICAEHAQVLVKIMFLRLALILIRRQCKIINLSFSGKEETIADAIKKGQQV